ncbi:hypothetical protein Pfo_014895 [Paulownia fortunei]|nr:hypothetical protein Pfo_014895 [Paulownia fortunei]
MRNRERELPPTLRNKRMILMKLEILNLKSLTAPHPKCGKEHETESCRLKVAEQSWSWARVDFDVKRQAMFVRPLR